MRRALRDKPRLLDEVYAVLPGHDDSACGDARHKDEQATVEQMLTDLRAMRAEAGHQVDWASQAANESLRPG